MPHSVARPVPALSVLMLGLLRAIDRWLLIVALAVLAGCAAPRASIHVRPTPARPAAGRVAGHLTMPNRRALGDAVIYVDSLPAAARRTVVRQAPVRVLLGADAFEPRVVAVGRGDTVEFVNRDVRYHGPFSRSPSRPFELNLMAPGERRRVAFDHCGIVRVFCNLHPEASVYVFVAPSSMIARPEPSGAFNLPSLPPGSYAIHGWHPRYGDRRWNVQVTRRSVPLALSF